VKKITKKVKSKKIRKMKAY